ncbi:hypothetical protein I4U23_016085 [Adineta vaga]|nr:hypothetical protein I4U23_016085 [Adineta vaga]
MNNRFNLRRAIDRDNIALSELNQQVFRETFIDTFIIPVDEENLQYYFDKSVSPVIFANKIADTKQAIWVIEDTMHDDELVAFINVGPCYSYLSDLNLSEDGEIYRLYVRKTHHGYGLGRWLYLG